MKFFISVNHMHQNEGYKYNGIFFNTVIFIKCLLDKE